MTGRPPRQPTRLVRDPIEQTERFVEATDQALDAHERFLESWRAGLDAQRRLMGAWTAAFADQSVEQDRTTTRAVDTAPVRPLDHDRTERTPEDRLYDLERRQDAIERKVDRILEAIEER